jgi:hypothetical protein
MCMWTLNTTLLNASLSSREQYKTELYGNCNICCMGIELCALSMPMAVAAAKVFWHLHHRAWLFICNLCPVCCYCLDNTVWYTYVDLILGCLVACLGYNSMKFICETSLSNCPLRIIGCLEVPRVTLLWFSTADVVCD